MLEVAVAALALFAALALWGTLRHRSAERAQRRFDALVDTYLPVLRRKRRQLVRVDDYGLVDRSRWEREVGYFFDKVVFETLSGREARHVREGLEFYKERLEESVGRQRAGRGRRRAVRAGPDRPGVRAVLCRRARARRLAGEPDRRRRATRVPT